MRQVCADAGSALGLAADHAIPSIHRVTVRFPAAPSSHPVGAAVPATVRAPTPFVVTVAAIDLAADADIQSRRGGSRPDAEVGAVRMDPPGRTDRKSVV